jgi:cytochrome P450
LLYQVVSTHGPAFSQAVLADMPKLEACIREVTRLLPASRVVMRQATERLSLCGVEVPRSAYMICSVDCMHALEPTLWKGAASIPAGARVPPYMDWKGGLAEAFQPERWLGDASSRPRHMLTFGFGPHL